MKHLKPIIRTVLIVFCCGLFPVGAMATESKPIRVDQENLAKLEPADQARVLAIVDRLETITAMDRSELTPAERKCLREETRELKQEVNTFNNSGGGPVIYISVFTVIIILLIIIIVT